MTADPRTRFRQLHEGGCFVIPNPWDVGSAKVLEDVGFAAVATTSSGLAISIGKRDGEVTLDELTRHVESLVKALTIPVHVDAERLFADTPDGVAASVRQLAEVGASGASIEDYDRVNDAIEDADVFAERVTAAAEAAHAAGMLLTARAENLLRGVGDVGESIRRLRIYRAAGADVVFAPSVGTITNARAVVDAVDAPVNVLLWPRDAFTVGELAAVGVRRISTGGALARSAYDALRTHAEALLDGQEVEP